MPRTEITLRTKDGACPATLAKPAGKGPWPGVIFFMDGIGYRPLLAEMAERLAGHGYVVLLPDIFYRYRPYEPISFAAPPPEEERAKLMKRVYESFDPARMKMDIAAFLGALDGDPDVAKGGYGCTGYCMGGRWALIAAGMFPDRFAAAASFHGGGLATETPDSPHHLAAAHHPRREPPEPEHARPLPGRRGRWLRGRHPVGRGGRYQGGRSGEQGRSRYLNTAGYNWLASFTPGAGRLDRGPAQWRLLQHTETSMNSSPRSLLIPVLTGVMALAGTSAAQAQDERGRVLSSTPVIQQIAVPQQVCQNVTVREPARTSGAGAIMGAIAGGAMGNAIGDGNGRAAATAIGLFGGAILGNKIEGKGQSHTRTVQECSTQNVMENRVVAYDVVYEYAGRRYTTQMPQDVGVSCDS